MGNKVTKVLYIFFQFTAVEMLIYINIKFLHGEVGSYYAEITVLYLICGNRKFQHFHTLFTKV